MKKIKYLTPRCCKDKRNARIRRAYEFDKGTDKKHAKKNIVYKDEDITLCFWNPGKDDNEKQRDLNPEVIAADFNNSGYSFKKIWGEICKLQIILTEDEMTQVYFLIYRLAYLYDFDNDIPSKEFLDDIKMIQDKIDKKNYKFNLKAFLGFLDLMGWNEDYKYQKSKDVSKNPNIGRLNCLLCMIAVPYEIGKLRCNKDEMNYVDRIIDMCYSFSISRGLYQLKKDELIDALYPYIIE